MLSDTVGLVRDLPHQLVDAFKATLEETAEADLLLHVIDGSSPNRRDQAEQVEAVLAEIGAGDIPTIAVYNKLDCLTEAGANAEQMMPPLPVNPSENGDLDARFTVPCDSICRVAVSAVTGDGIDELKTKIAEQVGTLNNAQAEQSRPGDAHRDDWHPGASTA
jgi:GTP-binding protein HflX